MKNKTNKKVIFTIIAAVVIIALACILVYAIATGKNSDGKITTTQPSTSQASTTEGSSSQTSTASTTVSTSASTAKTTVKKSSQTNTSATIKSTSSSASITSQYYLVVYRANNTVVAYTKSNDSTYSNVARTMVCSVGLSSTPTPTGTFKTSDKYVWRSLNGGVYGQYATRITGHILFHSVPYIKGQNKNLLEGTNSNSAGYQQYNKLGSPASQGCVRLAVKDCKWIYDNCSSGTTVKITDEALPSNITKPSAQKLSSSTPENKQWWDPTDPDSANPYN